MGHVSIIQYTSTDIPTVVAINYHIFRWVAGLSPVPSLFDLLALTTSEDWQRRKNPSFSFMRTNRMQVTNLNRFGQREDSGSDVHAVIATQKYNLTSTSSLNVRCSKTRIMLQLPFDHRAAIYRVTDYVWRHQFLALLGLFCLYLLFVRYRSELRRIPGPWLASVSSIWRFAVVWRQDMPATSIRLHARHGPLVRIGPHHVSVADPEAVKIIYGTDSRYQKVWRQLQLCRVWLTSSARQHSIKQLKPATKAMCSPTCLRPPEVTITLASEEPRDTYTQ